MIVSKNIINNKKLPEFITKHPVFETYSNFGKVFPHIGLKNFKCSIKKSFGQIPFIVNNEIFTAKIASIDSTLSLWRRILWKCINKPLYMVATSTDVIESFIFRKEFKDKDLRVVFSADSDEGVWDIATMAMRGISSCQSWGAGRRSHLIGSITDPCCGIIYVTDNNETKQGTNMLFRSIVRYVVHDKLGPCLFLERIYSQSHANSNILAGINALFACMLYRRSGLPVVYDPDSYINLKELVIPEFTIPCGIESFASYRDSGLQYIPLTQKFINRFPILGKLITSVYK